MGQMEGWIWPAGPNLRIPVQDQPTEHLLYLTLYELHLHSKILLTYLRRLLCDYTELKPGTQIGLDRGVLLDLQNPYPF